MRIDFSQNIKRAPSKKLPSDSCFVGEKNEPLNLGDVLRMILFNPPQDVKESSAEKSKTSRLAIKISMNDVVEVSIEELALLKKYAGFISMKELAYVIEEMLENPEPLKPELAST